MTLLVHDPNFKELMMQPVPFEVGMLYCEIVRKKSGFNILHPTFVLSIERNEKDRLSVMYAKKRVFNKTANYIISTESNSKRSSEQCLGKLRSNKDNSKYYLYDNGENPKLRYKVPY